MVNKDMNTQPTDAEEQYSLALIYETGRRVPQDSKKAIKWYTKSAEQGNQGAQYHLGLLYELGRGVSQDSDQAVKWYTESAEQGNPTAQYHLGV